MIDEIQWAELCVSVRKQYAEAVAEFLIEEGSSNGIVEEKSPADKDTVILKAYIKAKNLEKLPVENVFLNYEAHLYALFLKPPKCPPNINILLHGFGYISHNLNKKEKEFFFQSIDKYRKGQVSLSVPTNILKSWVLRFDEKYLENQSFFEPYPPELLSIDDINACEARDYWE